MKSYLDKTTHLLYLYLNLINRAPELKRSNQDNVYPASVDFRHCIIYKSQAITSKMLRIVSITFHKTGRWSSFFLTFHLSFRASKILALGKEKINTLHHHFCKHCHTIESAKSTKLQQKQRKSIHHHAEKTYKTYFYTEPKGLQNMMHLLIAYF